MVIHFYRFRLVGYEWRRLFAAGILVLEAYVQLKKDLIKSAITLNSKKERNLKAEIEIPRLH